MVVETDRQEVESVETVKKRIERGIDFFGEDMWINPIRATPSEKEVAFQKLKVMVDAVTSSNASSIYPSIYHYVCDSRGVVLHFPHAEQLC